MMRTWKYFFGTMLMACVPFAANAQFFMFGGGNRVNMDSLRGFLKRGGKVRSYSEKR